MTTNEPTYAEMEESYENEFKEKLNFLLSTYHGAINRIRLENILKGNEELKARIMALKKPILATVARSANFEEVAFYIIEGSENPGPKGLTFFEAEEYCKTRGLQMITPQIWEELGYDRLANLYFYNNHKRQKIDFNTSIQTWLASIPTNDKNSVNIGITLKPFKIDAIIRTEIGTANPHTTNPTLEVRPMVSFSIKYTKQDVIYSIPENPTLQWHIYRDVDLDVAAHYGLTSLERYKPEANTKIIPKQQNRFRHRIEGAIVGAGLTLGIIGVGYKDKSLPAQDPPTITITKDPSTEKTENENWERQKLIQNLKTYFIAPQDQKQIRSELIKSLPASVLENELPGLTPDNLTIHWIANEKKSAIQNNGKVNCSYKLPNKKTINFSIYLQESGTPTIIIKP